MFGQMIEGLMKEQYQSPNLRSHCNTWNSGRGKCQKQKKKNAYKEEKSPFNPQNYANLSPEIRSVNLLFAIDLENFKL